MRRDSTLESSHLQWTQPVMQHSETVQCAIKAECWGSVSFLAPSYFPAMVFPLLHFCSLFPSCIICPQIPFWLFPISTLYQGSWHFQAVFPRLLGQLASVQPMESSGERQEVGGRKKRGYFYLSLSVSSGFNSHQGPNFCIPKSSNTTASLCPLSTQVATISCCCLALHCLSVHSETSLLSQHLHNQLPRIKSHCGKY